MEASRSFVVECEAVAAPPGEPPLAGERALEAVLEDCVGGGGDLASVLIESCLLKGEMVSCILRKNLHEQTEYSMRMLYDAVNAHALRQSLVGHEI